MKLRPGPMNPVLARELRQRMRGRWTPVVISLYLLVLTGIVYLAYSAARRANIGDNFGNFGSVNGAAGRPIFEWLLLFVLLLLCFVVPGQAASAIAGERERQTLVPMQLTLLGPARILLGKLLASVAFMVLLVVATLPLVGIAFLLGGLSFSEALRGLLIVLFAALTLAALSITCSTLVRRVQTATIMAYGVTLTLLVGTFMAHGAMQIVAHRDFGSGGVALLVPNPVMATADIVGGTSGASQVVPSPLAALSDQIKRAEGRQFVPVGVQRIFTNSGPQFGPPPGFAGNQGRKPFVPFWLKSVLVWTVLSVGGLLLAARRLRVPAGSAIA